MGEPSLFGSEQHITGSVKEFNFFLKDTDGSVDLDRKYTWVKCNKDFKGYYVTDYSNDNFQALEQVLIQKPEEFSVGDRANLIHVAYTLAYLGSKSYATPALLTNYLELWENSYVAWRTFTWHMTKIASILEHRPGFVNLKEFGTAIVRSLMKRMDIWQDTGSHEERLLKANIIEFLCRMQDEECLINASEAFETIDPEYFNNPNQIENRLNFN